ncbi:MAG TPA: nucleotidyltransferase domain-containing protein [Longimicrobiales bacterium]
MIRSGRPRIRHVRTLHTHERRAVDLLLSRLLEADRPVRRVLLFGSKARGDFHRDSDVDILLLCDVDPRERDRVAAAAARVAARVTAETGVVIEPWTVPTADLEAGSRTPMLVDALDDGIPLWPPGAPALRLAFTPADARFCADCLLGWAAEGGPIVRRALEQRRWDDAAQRARDDITRLATAALLLDGDTRHRRVGSLRRFEARLVRRRTVSPAVLPAIAWAAAAYPAHGGRGVRPPPPTPQAIASAPVGHALAGTMERTVVPYILHRLAEG